MLFSFEANMKRIRQTNEPQPDLFLGIFVKDLQLTRVSMKKMVPFTHPQPDALPKDFTISEFHGDIYCRSLNPPEI